jgi:hypothetical protein
MKIRLFVMLALAAALFASLAPGAEAASTSSRLKKLEAAMKVEQAATRVQATTNASLKARLATAESKLAAANTKAAGLETKLTATANSLTHLQSCLQYAPITQYGTADSFGYLYGDGVFDGTGFGSFPTTALDWTINPATESFDAFLLLKPTCLSAAPPAPGARMAAPGATMFPEATVAHETKQAPKG